MPWFLSLCVGFLSLSQEIIWTRYVSFTYSGAPQAFSFVLTIYLLGIAFGAALGKTICGRTQQLYKAAAILLLTSGFLDIILPSVHSYFIAEKNIAASITLVIAIFLAAFLKAAIFPIAHHLGTNTETTKIGKSVSRVYFLNIIGSTLGPLATGFILLDLMGLQATILLMGLLTVALGVICQIKSKQLNIKMMTFSSLGVAIVAIISMNTPIIKNLVITGGVLATTNHVLESKAGIIHTRNDEYSKYYGDTVMGGNIYDGRTNVSLQRNSNMLERAVVPGLIHDEIKKVLIIGMSSGAWVRIITSYPDVEEIDVVEINSDYIELIKEYPELEPILHDKRVKIHIDDGRRWLSHQTDKKYDLIVMNTSFHWRIYATNILSMEFHTLIQKHLLPKGIVAFNTTDSIHAMKTADTAYPYAYLYGNFIYASDHDFMDKLTNTEKHMAFLYGLKLNGKALLGDDELSDQFLNTLKGHGFHKFADLAAHQGFPFDVPVITDWNMLTEYAYGRKFKLTRD